MTNPYLTKVDVLLPYNLLGRTNFLIYIYILKMSSFFYMCYSMSSLTILNLVVIRFEQKDPI